MSINNNQHKLTSFECLDSYRGILAYIVILDHSANYFKLPNDYQVDFLIKIKSF